MAHPTLYGIVPPIITPMNADESVNIPELRRQIERQIAGGVHGIFCFGTNGEGYILVVPLAVGYVLVLADVCRLIAPE